MKVIEKRYKLVEITPSFCGLTVIDEERLIQYFDTEEDAKVVLKALESVNIDFNVYKIICVDIFETTTSDRSDG